MRILVLRHGKASRDADTDAMRTLTDLGRERTLAVAELCRDTLADVTSICCSPLVRARQTAAIVKPFTSKNAHLLIHHSLTSESSPESVTEFIQTLNDSCILLVSHMPLVSELVGWFTDCYPGPDFSTSSLACLNLSKAARGCGELEWLRNPQ